MRRRCLGSLFLLVAGCASDAHSLDWWIEFAPTVDATDAVRVRTRILAGGCEGTNELYVESVLPTDPSGPAPAPLPAGRYGFEAEAIDRNCVAYAAGCEDLTLPDALRSSVIVILSEPGGPLCPAAECDEGTCRAPLDGGLDGGDTDAADTAVVDADLDADGAMDGAVDALVVDTAVMDTAVVDTAPPPTCAERFASTSIDEVCSGTATACNVWFSGLEVDDCNNLCRMGGLRCSSASNSTGGPCSSGGGNAECHDRRLSLYCRCVL